MDAVIVLVGLAFLILYSSNGKNKLPGEILTQDDYVNTAATGDVDMSSRVSKLNENFYEDQDAFMEIAHALGFPKGDQI